MVFIDGIMDRYQYKRISCKNIQCYKEIFGLDNDPKHTLNYIKEYFKNSNINTLEWPAKPPDLNAIDFMGLYEPGSQSISKDKKRTKGKSGWNME